MTRQIAGIVADTLTAATGNGYTVDTSPEWDEYRVVYIDGPDTQRLSVGLSWKDADRLEITGVLPRSDRRGSQHEITVGRMRDPQAIVKEVQRRLLPGYTAELAETLAYNTRKDDDATKRRAAADRLADLLGTTRDREDGNSWRSTVRSRVTDGGYGDFTLNSDGSTVAIDLRSVPFLTAHVIAEVLAASIKDRS